LPTSRRAAVRRTKQDRARDVVVWPSGRESGSLKAALACKGAQALRRAPGEPISTIRPRYITATRSQMCLTRRRSWAMNSRSGSGAAADPSAG
jgi:hypothetical protein